VTPDRSDTRPAIDAPDVAVDDPTASLEADASGSASPRPAATDPQLAPSAVTTPERPQRRAPRGGAARLLTLMRSLWIIVRERAR
jgi:hypothetical protein